MSRFLRAIAAATPLGLLLMVGAARAPVAGAGVQNSITVPMASEAWYLENPTCNTLAGCVTPPRALINPLANDTLHVSIVLGVEIARSYLTFNLTKLPSGASIFGGRLTVPIDTTPMDGTISPEESHVVACLVTLPIVPTQGSLEFPPVPDCAVSSPGIYSAKVQPTLTFDLTPFGSWWSGSASVALVPAQSASAARESWSVVFSSTSRQSPPSPPATAELTYELPDETVPSATYVPPLPPPVPPPALLPNTGPVLVPQSPRIPPSTVEPRTAALAPRTAALAPLKGRYLYPGVWALPLVLLAVWLALAKGLTQDLHRARP